MVDHIPENLYKKNKIIHAFKVRLLIRRKFKMMTMKFHDLNHHLTKKIHFTFLGLI